MLFVDVDLLYFLTLFHFSPLLSTSLRFSSFLSTSLHFPSSTLSLPLLSFTFLCFPLFSFVFLSFLYCCYCLLLPPAARSEHSSFVRRVITVCIFIFFSFISCSSKLYLLYFILLSDVSFYISLSLHLSSSLLLCPPIISFSRSSSLLFSPLLSYSSAILLSSSLLFSSLPLLISSSPPLPHIISPHLSVDSIGLLDTSLGYPMVAKSVAGDRKGLLVEVI